MSQHVHAAMLNMSTTMCIKLWMKQALLVVQVDHLKLEVARLVALVPGAQTKGKDANGLEPVGGKDAVV